MALTTVYTTDVDISVVTFIVETTITTILSLIGLLTPERELREVFEYRQVRQRGYVHIRGHSYVPPFLVHFFTFGRRYAILLLLVTLAMMVSGMIGALVATDTEITSLERRNWSTCRNWVAEDASNRLLEGMNSANFVCANIATEESSGVFFDGERLRCSDFKFDAGADHCSVLSVNRQIRDNCKESSRLKPVHEAISKGGLFRITELRSGAVSALLTPQLRKVWAEFGTNATILGKELVVTCSLGVDFENLESSFFLSTDFNDCIFITDGVYFFTAGMSEPAEAESLGRPFASIEEKIQVLIVNPGRVIRSSLIGTLVDVGGLAEHSTLTNLEARLAAPDGLALVRHSFINGQRIFRDFLSVALCCSRQAEAFELVTRSAIEVRWYVVVVVAAILGFLLVVGIGNKVVISNQEFRLSTPSGREADRYVDDVLRKNACDEPRVEEEVIGVIQKTECDHVGAASNVHARRFGRRQHFLLR